MGDTFNTVINISHKFSEGEYSRRTLEKYYVFSIVIERLIFQEELSGVADCSYDSIVECVNTCSKGKYNDDEWIGRWIAELKFMGFISSVEGESLRLQLTEKGKESYSQQTFQSIYAELMNARESRRLAIVAICISLVALFFSSWPLIRSLIDWIQALLPSA